jgi:ribosomal protein L7/L12
MMRVLLKRSDTVPYSKEDFLTAIKRALASLEELSKDNPGEAFVSLEEGINLLTMKANELEYPRPAFGVIPLVERETNFPPGMFASAYAVCLEEELPWQFDLILDSYPKGNRVKVVGLLRRELNLILPEAIELTLNLPKKVIEKGCKGAVGILKRKLEELGCKLEVKASNQ